VSRASFRSAYGCEFGAESYCWGRRMNWEQPNFPRGHILHPLRWRTFFSLSILPGQIINSYLFPVIFFCSFPLYYTLRMLFSLLTSSKVHVTITVRRLGASNISRRTGHRRNEFNACHSAEVSPKASGPDSEMLSANYQGCG
jgi:hypothetical protein